MSDLVVVGGGEFGRVVIETAQTAGWNVLGFLDPDPCLETVTRLNVPHLGGDDAAQDYATAKFVLGIGSTKISHARLKLVSRYNFADDKWATIVHPRATVSPTAILEHGAVVLAGAVICSGAHIGRHTIINIGAMIDHDVKVGRYVHVCPGVCLGGGVNIDDHAYIGLSASVRDHSYIGSFTMVAMGAVVTKSFHYDVTVKGDYDLTIAGVPARKIIRQPAPTETTP